VGNRGASGWIGAAARCALLLALACPAGAGAQMSAGTDADHRRDRLAALASSYQAATDAGDSAMVEELARRWLQLANELQDPLETARAELALGSLRRRQGRLDEARELIDIALPVLRDLEQPRALVAALTMRAQMHRSQGEYYESLALESESLQTRLALDPPERPHVSMFHLAALYEQMEDFERALALQYQALTTARADSDPLAEGSALNRLAGLLNDLQPDNPEEARGHAQAALAIHQRAGSRPGMLNSRFHIARAAINAGRFDEAEALLDQCFDEAVALDQPASQAHIQFRRAELELRREDPAQAQALMLDAIDRYERLGNRHRLAKAHGLLAEMRGELGDTEGELRARLEHYRLRDELLGAGATRRVNDLIDQLRLRDERARIEVLERDNRIQQLELRQREAGQRLNLLLWAMAGLVLVILVARYRHSLARSRLLLEQSRVLAEQGQALSEANRQLAAQASELKQLTETDSLTGLPNRAHGLRLLNETIASARSRGEDLGVLILDLDHFKAVNDQHGHLAGDEVLRQAASLMAKALREDGFIARLGGEEFLGVVTGAEDVLARANRLREEFSRLGVRTEGKELRLTVSIGLVRLHQLREASVPDLLRAADQALYAAKHAGRNRVVAWPNSGDGRVVELGAR
jgi:diguanylate cyclase (GGDEF)-like protein